MSKNRIYEFREIGEALLDWGRRIGSLPEYIKDMDNDAMSTCFMAMCANELQNISLNVRRLHRLAEERSYRDNVTHKNVSEGMLLGLLGTNATKIRDIPMTDMAGLTLVCIRGTLASRP